MTAHRHLWRGADFHVADGRPMMRQACACGMTRELRAFDVIWTPPVIDAVAPNVALNGGGRGATGSHPAEPGS